MRFFVDFIMGAIASLESQALFGPIWIGFSFRDIVVYVIFGFFATNRNLDMSEYDRQNGEPAEPEDISSGIFSPDDNDQTNN
jgi:hypothetical protein